MRDTSLRVVTLSLFLLTAGCSLLVSSDTSCSADTDCAEGAVCREGLCVRPTPPWADGGFYIDAGIVDAGEEPDDGGVEPEDAGSEDAGTEDAGASEDAGIEDAGIDDAGIEDAGLEQDAGIEDAGLEQDAGIEDAGLEQDAGIEPDAGIVVCPATPDCSLGECLGRLCAPGAHCSNGQCLRDGTDCVIDQVTGQSGCESAACVGARCGGGYGTCTAVGVCRHLVETECIIDVETGFAACDNPACKGVACGANNVCDGETCLECGSPCGTALPGCTNGIDCRSGDCAASCQCLGNAGDFFCDGDCVDLTSDVDHCGECGHACLSASFCSGGCCGDYTDCSFAVSSLCQAFGYECVEEDGVRRARETACDDGNDNDGDEAVDCADPDCAGKACDSGTCSDGVCCNTACAGACDVCSSALGATADGTCTVVPAGTSCGGFLCDGASAACPTACQDSDECAESFECANTVCLKAAGQLCETPGECASGACNSGTCS
ncbi:MAG: hypothetical protein ACOX6T_09330 [Myxococcales bacterium]|jgi:hypothetical protein